MTLVTPNLYSIYAVFPCFTDQLNCVLCFYCVYIVLLFRLVWLLYLVNICCCWVYKLVLQLLPSASATIHRKPFPCKVAFRLRPNSHTPPTPWRDRLVSNQNIHNKSKPSMAWPLRYTGRPCNISSFQRHVTFGKPIFHLLIFSRIGAVSSRMRGRTFSAPASATGWNSRPLIFSWVVTFRCSRKRRITHTYLGLSCFGSRKLKYVDENSVAVSKYVST